MNKAKVALIQLLGSQANKNANLERAQVLIKQALLQQPDTKLVVLPECFNSPYDVLKFQEYSEVITPRNESVTTKFLSGIAQRYRITLIGGTIPEYDPQDGKLYNTCIVYDERGQLIGKHRKMHLFDINIPNGIEFQESKTLSFGNAITTVENSSSDCKILNKFGIGICYDMRFPELAMINSRRGAKLMVYPSAFNTVTGPLHWDILAKSRAIDNQIYIILCSPARDKSNPKNYQAYGHSIVVDPNGKVVSEAGEDEEIVFAELDVDLIEVVRQSIPITRQRRFDVYPDVSDLHGQK
ncbi:hypothetical protein TBLA_0A08440 [Henningerozyma blattae CBS 6284]|uniref:CN hydrolase domain-containing protein n=1 Tax=Henningerozyma blattae (strain ATCC 34711 / CBS 6284 / DSM 70876 / NBRC 10599 / NRRL Y-10934 / UCD 77-7) TaxID=1071380 RepID=I2GWY1_HENB6|nr:hypothetical protein TBLA_0A08440 [Tetrapisispora blattae CBS 6284]CCH58633.1 hypothetical protein TBLA_0A08440 [Tetrapisispora blattae CBS 6284]